MKKFNKTFLLFSTFLLTWSLLGFQISNVSAQETPEDVPTLQSLPHKENPHGGSASKYYFSQYVLVTGGKYSQRPSSTRIWQVAYSNGSRYAGWVTWTGRYTSVGYGVYTYEYTGFLNKG